MPLARLIGPVAGLLGAAGVAAAALASHGGYGEQLRTASQFALLHAAVLIALCRGEPGRASLLAATSILVGALLFCGDLALRAAAGRGLFPMAAPTGGMLMIGGWLLAGLATFLELKRN